VLAVVACAACGVFALIGGARSEPAVRKATVAVSTSASSAAPASTPAATVPTPTSAVRASAKPRLDARRIGAITLTRTAPIRPAPDARAPLVSQVGRGITLPVTKADGGWLQVMTPCEVTGWVRASDGTLVPAGHPTSSLADAVFVIDPGHGGTESGALGPDGVQEEDVNLQISRRLASALHGSRVYFTRTGHYNAGLRFRALLASTLHADAFLSMHENSGPTTPSLRPGTQAWRQVRSAASASLASLVWRNIYTALSRYRHVPWVANAKIGPLARPNARGTDYYAVLRQSTVPSVIVESLFINNRFEERMLQKPDIQDVIAGATASAAKTFVTSGQAAKAKPYPVKMDRAGAGGLPTTCTDPV
jgi:N-acetylmuramoyl-L-alanine amidase